MSALPSIATFVGTGGMSEKCQKQIQSFNASNLGEMPHARSIPVTLWSRGELYFGGLRVGPKIDTLNA